MTSYCIHNNDTHIYFFTASVSATMRSETNWIAEADYEPTQLSMTASTSSSNVDVTIKMFDYGNSGYAGAVICPVGASKTGVDPRVVCRPMELRYNTDSSVAYLFDSQFERRYVACHELGHTVGLRHSGDVNSCMYTSALSTEITLHDTVMIQDAY